MKVGLIGTGRMAAHRADKIAESGKHEIAWICSRSEQRARHFLEEHRLAGNGVEDHRGGPVEIVTDLEDALSRHPVDGVIDTAPNAVHKRNAERILGAGCHLFVEYPHACTVEDGRWMIDTARRAGLTMHVGLTHRFSAANRFMKKLLTGDSEELVGFDLGRAYSYSEVICSGNPISRWFDDDRLSGGMFIASMYHFIDQAMSFFGDPVALRATYSATRGERGTIERDTGHALLSFDSPVVVNIAYSRGFEKPGLGSRKLVVFERGYLEQTPDEITIRRPDDERTVELPPSDAMAEDTLRFFDLATGDGAAETAEWAQAALQVACSLQEDADLSGGRKP